jgi:hypothetical protein
VQASERQLDGGGAGGDGDGVLGADPAGELPLELGDLRTGGHPARLKDTGCRGPGFTADLGHGELDPFAALTQLSDRAHVTLPPGRPAWLGPSVTMRPPDKPSVFALRWRIRGSGGCSIRVSSAYVVCWRLRHGNGKGGRFAPDTRCDSLGILLDQ